MDAAHQITVILAHHLRYCAAVHYIYVVVGKDLEIVHADTSKAFPRGSSSSLKIALSMRSNKLER